MRSKTFTIVAFLASASTVLAQQGDPPPGGGTPIHIPDGFGRGFSAVAAAIGSALVTLAIPIVAIMVIWGGFQIMTAGGSEEKVSSGRKTITYAAIGFAVVLFSSQIVPLIQEILAGQ